MLDTDHGSHPLGIHLHPPELSSRVLPFRPSTPRHPTHKVWWETQYRISREHLYGAFFAGNIPAGYGVMAAGQAVFICLVSVVPTS
jgi:hypothetical protein